MGLSISCAYCSKPLLDAAHAKKHVLTSCPSSPAAEMYSTLKFIRQVVHQAHHDGPIESCTINSCAAATAALAKAHEP